MLTYWSNDSNDGSNINSSNKSNNNNKIGVWATSCLAFTFESLGGGG